MGGIVAVVASIAVTPWNLYGSPAAITYFLGSLGALLGPFFGILVIDYFYFKRARVDLRDLYSPARDGRYYYHRGVNMNALIAFIPAAIIALCIALVPVPLLQTLAPFSWFIAAPLGSLCYWTVMRVRGVEERLVPEPVDGGQDEAEAA